MEYRIQRTNYTVTISYRLPGEYPLRLTMYLMRIGTSANATALRNTANVEECVITATDDSIKRIYLSRGATKTPAWISQLQKISGVDASDGAFDGQSVGSIIFIERRGRIAAVTFGTGFHALDPSLIERGFGLRVTANMVATGQVRGAQTRGVASNSRDQKTLLPVDGQFSELNIEVDEDWIRQLAGKSSDKDFATSLAGSDSLRITIPDFSLTSIGEKVEEVLEVHEQKGYLNKFPFLDQITPIDRSDPIIEILDRLVSRQLHDEEPSLSFAAPDPFDQPMLDHYELTCGYVGRFRLDDLDSHAIFEVVRQLDSSRDPLDDIRVFALDEDDAHVDRVQPLKSYIQTEVVHKDSSYLLSAGLWFAVRDDFVAEVNRLVGEIDDLTETLALPRWNVEELKKDKTDKTDEGSYNNIVASLRGYALLDKKLVYFAKNQKLEICDLLTPAGELLCVKSASSSATLSHLVAQAINSSKTWGNEKYQEKLRGAWEELNGVNVDSLERKDATFVLTIASHKTGRLSESLFFFTKVQIASMIRTISDAGFKVALAKIEMEGVSATRVPRKKRQGQKVLRT
ncbi:DUF6119 family protein [Arthrobacter psychrolactophilus]